MLVSQLVVVCVFLIFILVRSRVFAKNVNHDQVRHSLDPTPFPNSFKCFTCEKAKDNYHCNRWAEDKWCPQHTHFCKTVHHFNSHGKSMSVTKKCAMKEECHSLGCHHRMDSGHTECVSCCEGAICNVEVPTNHTNAIFSVMNSYRKSDACRSTSYSIIMVSAVLLLLLLKP
ncbi:ly6/PLAUR domain-containing protein 6B [Xenopus laevis]|uniref:Ly6/PLAUR domain-containing protein 6B n=2 Tax=Xenopus laevis TaxID=8355 RepID=A0A1L8ENY4_XENLA|nr:ly6/PLAUR domain-containing protein 6B [Xenopus laevis]XP_018094261.1 ly6/PLAUR domain-containing protein 6B [Xenopus laevis]OCT61052.1 hypothetical protein XELAEV_18047080mg [Xenopus laevis]